MRDDIIVMPPSSIPPPPILPATRGNIAAPRHTFQGLSVSTQLYGPNRPWFDPQVADLTLKNDRMAFYKAHTDMRDTHINLSLDLTGLPSVARVGAIAKEAIEEGGISGIILCCMGDGHGQPNSDPGSLGYLWLMDNFRAIFNGIYTIEVAGQSLAKRTIFVPGYDGIVPDWQPPSSVDRFAFMARNILDRAGAGYLGLELSAGYSKWGTDDGIERNNWVTDAGKCFDTILQEGPIDMGPPIPCPPPPIIDAQWSQVYQILGRMVRPYFPVPGQWDDMGHTPWYLGEGTSRGEFYYSWWEYDLYAWSLPWRRGGPPYPIEKVLAHRQAAYDAGCKYVG